MTVSNWSLQFGMIFLWMCEIPFCRLHDERAKILLNAGLRRDVPLADADAIPWPTEVFELTNRRLLGRPSQSVTKPLAQRNEPYFQQNIFFELISIFNSKKSENKTTPFFFDTTPWEVVNS